MSNIKNLQMKEYLNIYIPLIDEEVQEKIIKEYEEINFSINKKEIQKIKEEILRKYL